MNRTMINLLPWQRILPVQSHPPRVPSLILCRSSIRAPGVLRSDLPCARLLMTRNCHCCMFSNLDLIGMARSSTHMPGEIQQDHPCAVIPAKQATLVLTMTTAAMIRPLPTTTRFATMTTCARMMPSTATTMSVMTSCCRCPLMGRSLRGRWLQQRRLRGRMTLRR
jgi:hypothetical protein